MSSSILTLLALTFLGNDVEAFAIRPSTRVSPVKSISFGYKKSPIQESPLFFQNERSNSIRMQKKLRLGPKRKHASALFLWKNTRDDDDKFVDNKKAEKVDNPVLAKVTEPIKNTLSSIEAKWTQFWDTVFSALPLPLRKVMTQIMEKLGEILPTLRTISLSFVAGGIVAIAAVVVPVFTHVDKFTEPITLFETILNDLDARYVDEVDTQKLFETGVSAMLRSLDPYTEFEGRTEAVEMQESVSGKYGGVGLVIAGRNANSPPPSAQLEDENGNVVSSEEGMLLLNRVNDDPLDPTAVKEEQSQKVKSQQDKDRKLAANANEKDKIGITVVGAFEGYAFDAGMRVGDKIVAVGDYKVNSKTTVDEVRNRLRGEPGSSVEVSFTRAGVNGIQSVQLPRQIVKIHDVKAATLVGDARDGVGYIELRGFSEDAGREMRAAITALQRRAEYASNGEHGLKGLVFDLRQNPGGLLTSAVDVASLFVPKNADIVSAKGRGFPSLLYRSRVDPLVSADTKVVVLVSSGTASAAEIVSGAIQDHDVGVILGSDRTYGKGLVQNVEELPFDTALKFTVAKYYTPSGRCIQSTKYTEGGGKRAEDSSFTATKIEDKDRGDFYTRGGRLVKDGGGIEADMKVQAPKASALEVSLLRANLLNEYAAKWSTNHELNNKNVFGLVSDETYQDFQKFVMQKQDSKEVDLLAQIYGQPFDTLRKSLQQSDYTHSLKMELAALQNSILREMKADFVKYRKDITEDLEQAILARYLPESMLIERAITHDVQVDAARKLISNDPKFNQLLARTTTPGASYAAEGTQLAAERPRNKMVTDSFGITPLEDEKDIGVRLNVQF